MSPLLVVCRVIGGACFVRFASALTSEFSRHTRIAVDVVMVLFGLLNFELRLLDTRAWSKTNFGV